MTLFSNIYKYASLSQTRLTLRQLLNSQINIKNIKNIKNTTNNNTNKLLSNANFLKNELSIRLSKRVIQFEEFSKYNIFNTTNILKLYTESSNKRSLDKESSTPLAKDTGMNSTKITITDRILGFILI